MLPSLDRLMVLRPGEVWLAGAGPGDPRHLTLWALAGLQQADVIVHDALIDTRTLALAHADAQLTSVGKRGGQPSWRQGDINAKLIELAKAGMRVLRLKGGDPTVFARGAEEAAALAEHGIPFQFIPGVTAGLAALAMCNMPATLRGVNQAIVLATGHDVDGLDWQALVQLDQPVLFYMGTTHLPAIIMRLMQAGMPADREAAAISAATLPNERIVVATVGTLAETVACAALERPVMVVIGRIVATRARLGAQFGI